MHMSDRYVDTVLLRAQELLWGGSETENIEAHNMIAKLIKDRMQVINLQHPSLFDTIEQTTN